MRSSSEPGQWRTSRTPYLREPMDCLSATSEIEELVLMFAAQLGKTEVLLNELGYIVDHAPGPTLVVQPTVDTAKRFSKQRVTPLFDTTTRLSGKISEVKSRDSRASMFVREFLGGVLILTGANSAVGLRSMPARYLLCDEIDGYPLDIDGEGDPISLAEARQRTFARRKTGKVSSPTLAGASAIESAYIATDQRRFFVPCPHCGAFQVLVFDRLAWSRLNRPPSKALYLCERCDRPLEERHKTEMLAAGEWRPTYQDPMPTVFGEASGTKPNDEPSAKVRGYHLSGLYAPLGWLSWGKIASDWVRACNEKEPAKRESRRKSVVNTSLGLCYRQDGEAPEWKPLYDRRETYPLNVVPARALFLTAGVDVQKDRLVVEVVAWGRGKESWSIDYGLIPGNTADLSENGPWPALDALLARGFPHEVAGVDMQILCLAVDSGYNTMEVYGWARRTDPYMRRVIAIKGQDAGAALLGTPHSVEITIRGKRPVHGYKVWPVVGGIAKDELYGALKLERPADGQPFPPTYCHFPQYDEDYFKQLTAEHVVTTKNKRGFPVQAWAAIPGRENHVLDCRVYARAAASLVGLDRFQESDWIAFEQQLGIVLAKAMAEAAEAGSQAKAQRDKESWFRRRG